MAPQACKRLQYNSWRGKQWSLGCIPETMLTSIKVQSWAISKDDTDWQRILSDDHLRMIYNKHLQSLVTQGWITMSTMLQYWLLETSPWPSTKGNVRGDSNWAMPPLPPFCPAVTNFSMPSGEPLNCPSLSNQPCRLIFDNSPITLPSLSHMQKQSGTQRYAQKSTTWSSTRMLLGIISAC